MPVLQYDISVVGLQNVERAIATIEKRFQDHSRRMVAASNRVTNTPAVRASARSAARAGSPEKEMQAAARAAAQLDRQRSTALFSQYRQRERLEAKAARDEARNIEKNARLSAREAARAQREFRARTGAVVGKVGQSLAGIGKTALAVTGLGGGALIASKIGPAMALEKAQRAIAIQGKQDGHGSPLNYEQIRDKVSSTAIATGTSAEDVTAGFAKYVSKTGDVKGASDNLKTFATVASAAGASVEDVASAAAALSDSMDIKSAEDMQKALASIYYQGKKGAFELKDMSQYMSNLAATAASLGIKGLGGVQTLGGLTQIAMKGTGNTAEAATAMKDAMSELVTKGADLESGAALGGRRVKVFEGKGVDKHIGDIRGILADTIAKGDVSQLNKIMGKRGVALLNPMISGAHEAYANSGGGKKGESAARDYVLRAIQDNADAAGTFKDIQGDMSDAMKSASAQLEILNSELTAAVQKDLLPALIRLVPHLQKLVPSFEKVVEKLSEFIAWAAENPWAGLGSLVLGKVAADLAGAGIGEGVKRSILMAMDAMRGGGSGGTPGVPGTGGGKRNPLALVPLAGELGVLAGAYAGNKVAGSIDKYGGAYLSALGTETDVMKGDLTGDAASQRLAELSAARNSLQGSAPGMIDKLAYLGSGQSADQAREKAINELSAAMVKLQGAIERNTNAGGGSPNRGNSPSPIKS